MTGAKVGLPCHVGWSGSVFRVSGGTKSYNMAFKVILIPLEECVSEAMVDILGRLLSMVQRMVVQKYGSAVALLQLTRTHK